MAKKKKVSLNDPQYQAAFNQAKMQAAASRAQKAQKAKSIRKQGWNMAKEGLYDGIVQNSINVVDGALSGALKAFGPGDKKTMIKGAIEGIADAHPGKKALESMSKTVRGIGKGLFNDLSWYDNYPESTLEMIGPNFNIRNGIYEPLYDMDSGVQVKPGLPSASAVWIRLVRGDDTESAVTTSINRIFTSIRQANSGTVNWSPYQFDAYLYNYRLIIALYSVITRGLKYLNKFSVTDKGVPQSLFAAMGLDYDDIALNSADIRNYLTNLRVRMSGFAIPQFDILKRTRWLFTNGFHDSDDKKHQTYFMCPYIEKFYSLSTNDLSSFQNGSSLSPVVPGSDLGKKWSTIKTMFDGLVTNMVNTDVYSVISGDVVKAYGVEPLFKLDPVPSVDELPSEGYNEEVLQQIQNAYIAKTINGAGSYVHTLTHANITDVGLTESITYVDSTYQTNPQYANTHTLINMYKNGISNLDVLGATRFVSFVSNDGANYTVDSYGTEIFEQIEYFYFNYATNNYAKNKVAKVVCGSLLIVNLNTAANIEFAALPGVMWSAFDWSPRQIQKLNLYDSTGTLQAYICQTLFDINNYAKIDTLEQLRSIHNVATQSLYYSPLLSRVMNNVVDYSN